MNLTVVKNTLYIFSVFSINESGTLSILVSSISIIISSINISSSSISIIIR